MFSRVLITLLARVRTVVKPRPAHLQPDVCLFMSDFMMTFLIVFLSDALKI